MKMVFVYNADAGRWNALLDSAHKLLRPDTYECALCQLTHGALGEKKAWKTFREESGIEMEFLHRNEWSSEHGAEQDLPVILRVEEDTSEVLLSAVEIAACKDLEALIDRIRTRTR